MGSSSLLRLPFLFTISVVYLFPANCHALVINAPTWGGNGSVTTKKRVDTETKIELLDLEVKIRRTKESDIQEIANMLTYAILEEEDAGRGASARSSKLQISSPLNFRFRNTRSKVSNLLQSRMNAIKTGRNLMRGHATKGTLDGLTEADKLRLLWSNDAFRNSMEKAASLSHEPHIWKDHIFHCAPPSFDWLFHKMITAENAITGEIIGFCEIGMLSKPLEESSSAVSSASASSSYYDEECSLEDEETALPTFMNVVTSTKYRRRGVASTIVDSAMRFVQKRSSSSSMSDQVALYVEEGNTPAIKMYERLGFEKRQRVNSKEQWYMTRQISWDPSREALSKHDAETIMYNI
eukprot:jgi/Psemu1/182778/e_gw1.28.30.1